MPFNKMKTGIAITIFVLGGLSLSFGQKLQWSMPQKVSQRAFITECLGSNASGLFIIKKNSRNQDRDIMLERYSSDMHHIINKVIAGHRNEYYLNLILDTGGIRMFYAQIDFEKKRVNVRLRNINFNLVEYGKDTTLFSFSGTNPAAALISVYKLKMSPYVFITYTVDPAEFPASYNYVMLDENYARIYGGSINLGAQNHLTIEQATFTHNQAAFLVRDDAGTKVLKQGYRFFVYQLKFSDSSLARAALFNDNYTVTEGILKTDFKNNNIVFAGLFANLDSSYVKGYCVFKDNLTTGTETIDFKPFPADIVSEMEGRRIKIQGIFNLRAGDLDFRADGGVILSNEEYQETHESVSDFNAYGVAQPSVRNYYYYENLLVLSINPNSNLDWHTVLRKDQVSVNDNGTFSSYLLAVMPDRLVYVYNDLTRKNWNLSVAKIDEKGQIENEILVKPQNFDGRMIPQYGYQISYNQFIVPELTPRGIIILKVTY